MVVVAAVSGVRPAPFRGPRLRRRIVGALEESMPVKDRTVGRLAWALGLVALALTAGGLAFGVKNGSSPWSYGGASALVLVGAFGGLGALLASRRPANPIGWIFIATGILFAAAGLADQYSRYGLV